ncbi:hypothetical protein Lfu02_60030 [Longispora fulva]|uniref:Uncharacterized protein n=1 Tax=Longispora fulva TaxID=619741 RepID=A0A8J7GHN9_9ACTN|nr:hypothetical protein [Longispora fulva]MBG6137015.1 hypothetical protein [Longispora fulva]GIG61631.1 hypothetical protein Lfu02_60030 [Longispora fulva]
MSRPLRSAALAAALAVTATGLTAAVSTPAQARPVCSSYYAIFDFTTQLFADGYYDCPDGSGGDAWVRLERQNAATGAWTVVAQGNGQALYNCAGTTPTAYRAWNGASFEQFRGTYACG